MKVSDGIASRATSTLRLHSAEASKAEHSGDTCGRDVVERTLCRARTAQSEWANRSVRDRLGFLKKIRLRIADHPREIAASVSRPDVAETLAAEVLPLLDACRFLEIEAPRILKEKWVGSKARPMWLWGTRVALRPEPLGVVLVIGPSNYPLMLPGIQILQAVAAGNAVLIKPAAHCTAAVQTLVDLAEESGLPRDLIQILDEDPLAAMSAIRCGVNKVFLTGSVITGRAVSRELAESATPAVMELSGCDAVFILDDADPELASDCLLFGLTLNHSQTCMAPRRVFASDRMVDCVISLLLKKLTVRRCSETVARGDAARTAVEKIQNAVAAGAKLLAGRISFSGGQAELQGVAILNEVTADMAVTQSDLFAPVLSFLRVRTEEQALQD
ncbi:MAG: aldehyde dehydrogenase family protein, partial [Fuerstia sp.]|nr:aldehyde dehydrogenase family protein [Fuerstiella sp.]